jgi:hypothetical protein
MPKKNLINIPSSFSFPRYHILKGSYILEVRKKRVSALESSLKCAQNGKRQCGQ